MGGILTAVTKKALGKSAIKSGTKNLEKTLLAQVKEPKVSSFKDSSVVHNEIREEFLNFFGQTDEASDIISRLDEVSPELRRIIKAVDKDGYGHDFLSQDIDFVLRNVTDASQDIPVATKAAIGRYINIKGGSPAPVGKLTPLQPVGKLTPVDTQ